MTSATITEDNAPRTSVPRFAPAFAVALLAAIAWLFTPGRDTFRTFDGPALGRAESGLWRDYYDRHYAALAGGLVSSDRRAFGLNPWDSLNSGLSAASAARTFQNSHSRAEAQAALPALTQHFAILARANHSRFDPARAAKLELEWWQVRRETDTGPGAYALQIAAATAYIYSVDPARLATYARLRAEAMDLRDQRDTKITSADWAKISALLEQAYTALRAEL